MWLYTQNTLTNLNDFSLKKIFVIMFYLIKKNINHSELKLLTTYIKSIPANRGMV